MSGQLLPHALLDLTLARVSARLESLACTSIRRSSAITKRHAHYQALLREAPPSDYLPEDRSMYARRESSRTASAMLAKGGLFPHSQDSPVTELERRITELKEASVIEVPETTEPLYSESELVSMYEDLLAIPSHTQTQDPVAADPGSQRKADEATLGRVVQALYELDDPTVIPTDSSSQYQAAITKLNDIVGALESAQSSNDSPLDLSILPTEEWLSLVRVCVHEKDGAAAESVISLMKRAGIAVPDEALNTTLSLYADRGDVANTERFLETYVGQTPAERQRDLHVKAYLRSVTPRTFPTAALKVLHEYEDRGIPAPQPTYTRAITTLLSVHSAVAEAHAWDLFAHMRYVAHPTPDAHLYTVMISACASRVLERQPARALDLWKEMTVDKGIPPTTEAYTAVIFACASSGKKLYVSEAFRLAKEMLDGHRDAYGNTAFHPDRITFCALLEGAKRIGDLRKVRWILAEIITQSVQAARGDVANPVFVDEGIMAHVFHAYAAHKPAFVRAATVLVDNSVNASYQDPSKTVPAPEASSSSTIPDEVSTAQANPNVPVAPKTQFTNLLPQTPAELLNEARTLFYRTLMDVVPAALESDVLFSERLPNNMPDAFQHIRLSPRLLNAYLSVHYIHAPFEEGSHLYRTLFSHLGVDKNAWSYVEALERCGRAKRGIERKQAEQFAREVWQEWQPVEEAWRRREPHPAGVNARMVERAYAAMIRILSLSGNSREAVQLVRTFVDTYPPDIVKLANPKHELRSTRTTLQASRPLVRLFAPVEIPDDTVPPLLSFPEVEVLHHRLVARGDLKNIGYLKWVCMAYAGALKRRKDATLHAEPVAQGVDRGSQAPLQVSEP
ncbi:hypothetical protein BD413DRAFT_474382 [Trametes elegans]|nr:hypothetical protein BD413DRAFT_474382 [Trametes elegans]